jgi:hypothetical protein
MKYEMDGACSTNGRHEKRIQSFYRRKQTTWETSDIDGSHIEVIKLSLYLTKHVMKTYLLIEHHDMRKY